MNQTTHGYLFSGRQSKSDSESVAERSSARLQADRTTLSQKEIEMLRLAKRAGTPLEATAKLILLLRARKKAVDSKAANG